MTKSNVIRIVPAPLTPAQAARRRARRRRVLLNTLAEAMATIGLGACFLLCAVMVLCVF